MMLLFDGLMILSLLWLAWRSLVSVDLFQGIVLFIAFGLLIALVWVRLHAVDIALAEAAIGSGLTGALLLATLGRLGRRMDKPAARPNAAEFSRPHRSTSLLVKLLSWFALLGLAVFSAWAIDAIPLGGTGLTALVSRHLPASGASNPVTAVLLNFRAYDTLLEVAVLLAAAVAVWSLAVLDTKNHFAPVPVVQSALTHLLAPLMLIVAGHLLWVGSFAPGGAFQSGAVLGGAGVLLVLSLPVQHIVHDRWLLRLLLILGLAVFIAVALLLMLPGRQLLQYPVQWAGALILLIETAAALSIGAILTFLFVGGKPEVLRPDLKPEPEKES